MEITVWSAGKNGIYAKLHLMIGIMLALVWLIILALFILECAMDTNSFFNIRYTVLRVLLLVLTFIEPLVGLHMINLSIKAYKRNKLITIKIYNKEEYIASRNEKQFVVYADNHGIVTCNDIASFEDWSYFKGIRKVKSYLKIYNKQYKDSRGV